MNAIENFKRSFLFLIQRDGLRGVITGFRLKYFGILAQVVLNYEYDLHFGATWGGSSGLFVNGPRWTDLHLDFSLLGFGVKLEVAFITGIRKKIFLSSVSSPGNTGTVPVSPIGLGPGGEGGLVDMTLDDGVIKS